MTLLLRAVEVKAYLTMTLSRLVGKQANVSRGNDVS
jgi:hypothetical protein